MVKGTKPKIYNKVNYYSSHLFSIWYGVSTGTGIYCLIQYILVLINQVDFSFYAKLDFCRIHKVHHCVCRLQIMDCRRAGQAIRLLFIRVHCQLRVKYHYINLDIRCESVKFAHVKYLYMVNVELVYAIFLSIPICRRSMLIFSLFMFDKL